MLALNYLVSPPLCAFLDTIKSKLFRFLKVICYSWHKRWAHMQSQKSTIAAFKPFPKHVIGIVALLHGLVVYASAEFFAQEKFSFLARSEALSVIGGG